MKISGGAKESLNGLLLETTNQVVVTAAPTTTKAQSEQEAAEFQASDDSLWLDDAQAALADTSDIDMSKVDSIRQAISDGSISVDLDVLSQAIVEMHRG